MAADVTVSEKSLNPSNEGSGCSPIHPELIEDISVTYSVALKYNLFVKLRYQSFIPSFAVPMSAKIGGSLTYS